MTEYYSYDHEAEVARQVVDAFLQGFPKEVRDQGNRILKSHGIDLDAKEAFYKLQSLLNAMKEVSERLGHTVLYLIGTKIAQNAILPEGIDSLEVCFEAIDQAYHMNHRGADIGYYRYSSSENDGAIERATVECRSPYPCSFDNGVLEGFSQRFKPDTCKDIFIHENEQSNCRKKGHESCFYHIVWT